ncbi:MAG: DUF885 domain-containing protein [Xanthomonadales bacterium]|nr:DUF885 domain-containing protein [Xanthomonadales bacterium]
MNSLPPIIHAELPTLRLQQRKSLGLSLLVTMALGLSLVGCGDTESTTADSGAATPETTAVIIAEESSLAEAVSASAQLDEVILQFANAQLDEDQNTEVQELSSAAFLAEIDRNSALLERVRGIDSDSLSFDEQIDQRLLIGLLESDTYTAQTRRMWEKDASIYIPAGQVGRLLEPASTQSPVERADALMVLLTAIPQQVQNGRDNLINPPQRFTEAAIFKAQGTIKSLKSDAGVLSGQGSASTEEFDTTLASAIASLESFELYLAEDVLPNANGSWAIGKEHYDYILQHRWLFDLDADDIYARGLQAFEETEALAQEVSERIQPGKHWSEVYETLKDEHPPADGIKQAYQAWIDKAQKFVIENQIVTLPAGEFVSTVDTPPAMRRSSPFGTFQGIDRFGTDLEGKLVLTPIEDWMTPEQQAQRLRSHHDAWIPVIAVHEAYPGHHVDALKTRENPRVLRKVVQEPIFSEGWGLFTEEMMFEQGFLQGDDVRLTQLRNRLWRAARVILDVSLHTGRMTFEEAVDFLAERVRFERYAAELEVGMYIERPTYVLGYLIGMQEIMKIREEWIARNGEPNPPSQFYDALLTVGSLPPVLVRESLLGRDSPVPAGDAGAGK